MEPNQDNLTDPSLTGAAHVDASDGSAAVDETLSLTELNSLLGKEFKDKPTALKAVKDTFSFVGKKIDAANPAPAPTPDLSLHSEVQQLKEQVFYANNPQYKGHESLIKAMGGDPSEVVNTEAFKNVFAKVQVADEVQKTKSVVASNSRLSPTSTFMEDAVKLANSTGGSRDTIADVLAKGIVEEMGLS